MGSESGGVGSGGFHGLSGKWEIQVEDNRIVRYDISDDGMISTDGSEGVQLRTSEHAAFPAGNGWFKFTDKGQRFYIRSDRGSIEIAGDTPISKSEETEADRRRKEEEERKEAERKRKEEEERKEADRKRKEEKERKEAERKRKEEEAERKRKEEEEAERKRKEEEAERKRKEEEAERKRKEEEAERKRKEEEEAERKRKEEEAEQ